MTEMLTICMAQLDFTVADIRENTNKIINAIQQAKQQHADIIVFPELTITSYPPEDLLLRKDFYQHITTALSEIEQQAEDICVVIGYPKQVNNHVYNTAAWIENKKITAEHFKHILPNYGVFDEQRYFTAGKAATVIDYKGVKIGLVICEDLWHADSVKVSKLAGAELIISLNASPFTLEKHDKRLEILTKRISEVNLPIIYVNHMCGQDDLLFDGRSLAMNIDKKLAVQAPAFTEGLYNVTFNCQNKCFNSGEISRQQDLEIIYQGLVTGVKDYINKNNFPGIVLGLSGGIDSALTLAIATDALGPDRVQAIMMPSQYTASMSQEDAEQQAATLHVDYQAIEIKPVFELFLQQLEPFFKDLPTDQTEENIQSRIRGTLLMALSNKTGKLVLTTGNKSEMAVGYATLYGDMAGGFCVLKDVYKTLVYELANYRNSVSPVIPQRVIDRPPSAELAPDQVDQDSLPPYDILDAIIDGFVEKDLGVNELIKLGFAEETVKKVLRLIHLNEYKRRQAPPGPRITSRSFGRNRRYPITSGFLKLLIN